MNVMAAQARRRLHGAVPDVRPPAKWIERGQGGPCMFLGLVILCEMSFIGYCLFFR